MSRPPSSAARRASSASCVGVMAPAGSLTRSRAQATASATATPRSSAGLHGRRPSCRAPRSVSRAGRVGLLLVAQELVGAERHALGEAWAAAARSPPVGTASSSVVATVFAFGLRRTTAAAARRRPSTVRAFLSPRPTRSAALAPSLPAGTASVSSALPSKPASVMNGSERPAEGGVERLAAGAEHPPGEDRHGEEVGRDLGRAALRRGWR